MKRLRHVIECDKGYLCDIEKYTKDLNAAATFSDYDQALKKLTTLSDRLVNDCWIGVVYLDFPHPIGYKNLISKTIN